MKLADDLVARGDDAVLHMSNGFKAQPAADHYLRAEALRRRATTLRHIEEGLDKRG